jgi:hypothetical protein
VLDPAMVHCGSWNVTLVAIESMLAGRPIFPESERLSNDLVQISSSEDQRPQSLLRQTPHESAAQRFQKRTLTVLDAVSGIAAGFDEQSDSCQQIPQSASVSMVSHSLGVPNPSTKTRDSSQQHDDSSAKGTHVTAPYLSS